jgi:hypothetical protein
VERQTNEPDRPSDDLLHAADSAALALILEFARPVTAKNPH